jgi:hypothetical protein
MSPPTSPRLGRAFYAAVPKEEHLFESQPSGLAIAARIFLLLMAFTVLSSS